VEAQTVYALDIGTRKIMGLVVQKRDECIEVLDSEMIEHQTRAMMDGQIHDVEAVAGAIRRITSTLQERLQIPLKAAAVAAAGRALKTARAKAQAKRSRLHEISRDEVRALEIEAVQRARMALLQEEQAQPAGVLQFFCVGYSVVYYRLEDQNIQSLVGQTGGFMELEVIATFLPRVVVDSLFSAMKQAGLELWSMTLEPIAALSIAIPPGMRLLNLALVDIGAGTSDIAIVKDGHIAAYAMVPMGGDELTEALAAHYLLDFHHAETVKRQMNSGQTIEMHDILNNTFRVESAALQEVLRPVINEICAQIAGQILSLNRKPPDAVICIGGGSLTPLLLPTLAEQLELPPNRVGIRTARGFEAIHSDNPYLQGPQGVTPLGIAYHSLLSPPLPFITVKLNDANLVLWNVGEMTVGNALLSSGASLASIYGRPGLGKSITVNGQLRVFPGTAGTAPLVRVNGQKATLDTLLNDGDQIDFVPGSSGEDARVTLADLITLEAGSFTVNGRQVHSKPLITVNGQEINNPDYEIPDRARVEYQAANLLKLILQQAGVDQYRLKPRLFTYYLENEEKRLLWLPVEVTVNSQAARLDDVVPWGAEVSYRLLPLCPTLQEVLQDTPASQLRVYVNDEEIVINTPGSGLLMDGQAVPITRELTDGTNISLDHEAGRAILSDIFQVYDLKPHSTGRLVLKVNGHEAGFSTLIKAGDRIEVYWEE